MKKMHQEIDEDHAVQSARYIRWAVARFRRNELFIALLAGAVVVLTFILVVLLTDKVKSREDMSFSRALDTVNIGTTANDGTGDPLRTAFAKINDVIIMLDSLDLDEVTGSLNYSTENYGSTGTGDIVLSTGATLTTVNITDVIKLTPTASPPAGATEGMIYADTDHHLYYYNGTSWISMTD
jgi:hypothetical protein